MIFNKTYVQLFLTLSSSLSFCACMNSDIRHGSRYRVSGLIVILLLFLFRLEEMDAYAIWSTIEIDKH